MSGITILLSINYESVFMFNLPISTQIKKLNKIYNQFIEELEKQSKHLKYSDIELKLSIIDGKNGYKNIQIVLHGHIFESSYENAWFVAEAIPKELIANIKIFKKTDVYRDESDIKLMDMFLFHVGSFSYPDKTPDPLFHVLDDQITIYYEKIRDVLDDVIKKIEDSLADYRLDKDRKLVVIPKQCT